MTEILRVLIDARERQRTAINLRFPRIYIVLVDEYAADLPFCCSCSTISTVNITNNILDILTHKIYSKVPNCSLPFDMAGFYPSLSNNRDFNEFLQQEEASRFNSTPANQFSAQVERLYKRLVASREEARSGLSNHLRDQLNKDKKVYEGLVKFASETIRTHWLQQGIWDSDWGQRPPSNARWMHEHASNKDWWSGFAVKPENKRQYIETYRISIDECDIGRAERQPPHTNPTDNSRPYNQFLSQVSKERERLLSLGRLPEDRVDINTSAYHSIRHVWEVQGIWDERWKTLPGMEWKHETSDREFQQWALGKFHRILDNHIQKAKESQVPKVPPPATARPLRGILKVPKQEPPPKRITRANSLEQALQAKSERLGLPSTGRKELPLNQALRGHTRPGEMSLQEALMKKDKQLGLGLMGRITPRPRAPGRLDFTVQAKRGDLLGLGRPRMAAVNTSLFEPSKGMTRLFPRGGPGQGSEPGNITESGRVTRSWARARQAQAEDLAAFPEALERSPESQFPSPGHYKRKGDCDTGGADPSPQRRRQSLWDGI